MYVYVCTDLLVIRYTASCKVEGMNSLLFPLRTSLESPAVIAVDSGFFVLFILSKSKTHDIYTYTYQKQSMY